MTAPVAPSESGPAGPGVRVRRPVVGGRRVADLVATITLLSIDAVVALVAGWGIVFLSLGFGSCTAPGNSCDETLGGVAVYAGPVLVALAVALAIVFSVLRLVRRRLAWPIPLTGLVAVVVVFFGALALVDSAITHGI
ncbi:hypothetical protein [Curtobacterium sp. VKM Ac-2922]|uniref:hypothetical protein n=1 Tax=Curtobacterium sp. VKM Ac-2922 TaxID=2929475 RepID=UPI001FB563DD|nr:hypothetical protein [Curtobacterium sp. VKM Ac-2922]MCJ1715385.1 hypothetical protein [Curtobacterium sp. VKM Ac-2922]